jgi:AraC family transcriptional regulator
MSNHPGWLIEQTDPITVAGYLGHYHHGFEPGITEQWQHFAQHMGTVPGRKGRTAYGLCFILANGMEYLSCVEVAANHQLSDEFCSSVIPPRKYLVFPHEDHVSKLCDTFDAIWREWLPKSGFQAVSPLLDSPNVIERYNENFCPDRPGNIEIWIPVKS